MQQRAGQGSAAGGQGNLGELAHEEAHAGSVVRNVANCQLLADAMASQDQAIHRHPATVVIHLLLLHIDLLLLV